MALPCVFLMINDKRNGKTTNIRRSTAASFPLSNNRDNKRPIFSRLLKL